MVKKVLTLICALIVLVGLVIGAFLYTTEYKLYEKGKEYSQDGKYEILFEQVGEPNWPFGATKVKITVTDVEDKEKIQVIETEIQDDGGTLRPENWEVEWNDTSVEIRLKASEQSDELYYVEFE